MVSRLGATDDRYEAFDRLRAGGFLFVEPVESAYDTLWGWQRALLGLSCAVVLVAIALWPISTLVVLNGLSATVYLLIMSFRFYTIHRAEQVTGTAVDVSEAEIGQLSDADLPIYTILCPLYKEEETVVQFLRGMAKLDYPFDRLDIRILLEEDDVGTIAAARAERARMGDPDSIHIVVVPDSQPKTKPKACNYGLVDAKGAFVVIYDAEDVPQPDQLKKALIAFSRLPESVVCIQAKLNYFNPTQNLLTRFFTSEYSMWFDLFLPGLSVVGAPIPLGGTSNHFKASALRKLGAWDAFNVAEDADLGMRIARAGLSTAVIDSTTWEEANSRVGNWIRQRSRWVKGYMQTWLVTMRHPLSVYRTLGAWRYFCFHATVGGTPFVFLMNPIYWCLSLLWLLTAWNVIPMLFPPLVFAISVMTALVGNMVFVYLSMYGLIKRERYDLVPLMFALPIYWVLQSIAAWKALIQLCTRPHYWEKTTHNLSTQAHVETPA